MLPKIAQRAVRVFRLSATSSSLHTKTNNKHNDVLVEQLCMCSSSLALLGRGEVGGLSLHAVELFSLLHQHMQHMDERITLNDRCVKRILMVLRSTSYVVVEEEVRVGLLQELHQRFVSGAMIRWRPRERVMAMHALAKGCPDAVVATMMKLTADASGATTITSPFLEELCAGLLHHLRALTTSDAALLLWSTSALHLWETALWANLCRRCADLHEGMDARSHKTLEQALRMAPPPPTAEGSTQTALMRMCHLCHVEKQECFVDDETDGAPPPLELPMLIHTQSMPLATMLSYLVDRWKAERVGDDVGEDVQRPSKEASGVLDAATHKLEDLHAVPPNIIIQFLRSLVEQKHINSLAMLLLKPQGHVSARRPPQHASSSSSSSSMLVLWRALLHQLCIDTTPSALIQSGCFSSCVEVLALHLNAVAQHHPRGDVEPEAVAQMMSALTKLMDHRLANGGSEMIGAELWSMVFAASMLRSFPARCSVANVLDDADALMCVDRVEKEMARYPLAWQHGWNGQPAKMIGACVEFLHAAARTLRRGGAAVLDHANSAAHGLQEVLAFVRHHTADLSLSSGMHLLCVLGELNVVAAVAPMTSALSAIVADTLSHNTPPLAHVGAFLMKASSRGEDIDVPDALVEIFVRLLMLEVSSSSSPPDRRPVQMEHERIILRIAHARRRHLHALEQLFLLLCTRRLGCRAAFVEVAQLSATGWIELATTAAPLMGGGGGGSSTVATNSRALSITTQLLQKVLREAIPNTHMLTELNAMAELLSSPMTERLRMKEQLGAALQTRTEELASRHASSSSRRTREAGQEKALLIAHLMRAGVEVQTSFLDSLRMDVGRHASSWIRGNEAD